MGTLSKLPSRLERGSHNTGPAFCSQCGHEWQAVTEVGAVVLECPNCHTWKGLMKGPVEPEFAAWTCNCGCKVFMISDTTNIICWNCGTIHGQQFFSDSE